MSLYSSSKRTSASLSNLSLGAGYSKRNYGGLGIRSYTLGQAASRGMGLTVGGRMAIKSSSGTRMGMGSSMGSLMGTAMGTAIGTAMGGGGNPSNEKEAMQNLNNRLASYLSQVKSLETSNLTLETKIKEISKPTTQGFDWSLYDPRVRSLLTQIEDLFCGNARLVLAIGSSRHRAEDFSIKFKSEEELSLSVASDIQTLHHLQAQYRDLATEAESQISCLEADIAQLRKDHEEEKLRLLDGQKGLNVEVGVTAAPAANLNQTLSEMRAQYQAMVTKQREESEAWYQKQLEMEELGTPGRGEETEAVKAELVRYRRQLQTLRSELDSTAGANQFLADSRLKVEERYEVELSKYQGVLSGLERDLNQLRTSTHQQSQQYQQLLHINSKLEAEITTYRALLETTNSEKMVLSSVGETKSTIGSDLKAETRAERATETKTVIRRVITTDTVYSDGADPISKTVVVTELPATRETGKWTLIDAEATVSTQPEGRARASLVAETEIETDAHIRLEPQVTTTLKTLKTSLETQPETPQTLEVSSQSQSEAQVGIKESGMLTLPDTQTERLEVQCDIPSDRQTVTLSEIHTETLPGIHTETLPEIHTETLPGIQTVTMSEIHTETLPGIQTVTMSEIHTETLPGIQTVTMSEIHTETLPEIQTVTMSEIHTETLPEIHTETLPGIQSVTVSDTQTVTLSEIQTETLPDTQTVTVSEILTETLPDTQTLTLSEIQNEILTDTQTVTVCEILTETLLAKMGTESEVTSEAMTGCLQDLSRDGVTEVQVTTIETVERTSEKRTTETQP